MSGSRLELTVQQVRVFRKFMDIAKLYEDITLAIADETGASDSLLHVHAGMAVLLVARILTGRSLATPIPFLVVCVAALANEVLDRITHGLWRPRDTSLDLVNTLFWPFVLMIGLRIRRSRKGKSSLDSRKSGRSAAHQLGPEARAVLERIQPPAEEIDFDPIAELNCLAVHATGQSTLNSAA